MNKLTSLFFSCLLLGNTMSAKNIFVDPTNGNDNNNGTTWELGVKTLGGAVTVAKTSFATGDNIYVKGGTLTYSAAYTTALANYYGSCDLSNTGTAINRTTLDLDGNSIIEPWEFQDATLIHSTANVSTANVTALTLSNVGYTFDGFTITHVANNSSVLYYLRTINLNAANINFTNCTLKNSTVTSTGIGYTGSTPYEMFFRIMGARVTNCLIEKNNVSYNTGNTGAAYPFIAANGGTYFSNNLIRNNLVTVNASASNATRSMLIAIYPSTIPSPIIKNCVVHNNEMVYNGGTSNVGAAISVYSVDGNDSIFNNTIANNKSTNVASVGLMTPSRSTTLNYVVNNALWNNIAGASTVANLNAATTTSASSLISKNFMNGGQSLTENGTTILSNDFSLSATNSTGSNQALFVTPTTIIGSSLGSLVATDSVAIRQSNWTLQTGSYFIAKGTFIASNGTDKAGNAYLSPSAVGAYEFGSNPPTQLQSTTSDFQCFSRNQSIVLQDAPIGVDLIIFNLNGVKIKSQIVQTAVLNIPMQKGIYFVSVAGKVKKVVVK